MAKTPDGTRFGMLGRDARGVPVQTACGFATHDAGSTPKTSPLAYSSSVITLVVPDSAVQLVLSPSTGLRISDDPTVTTYDVIGAGSKEAIPVALMQNVYIRRDTTDGTVTFRFVGV